MSCLTPFSFDAEVTRNDCREDKIELVLGTFSLSASRDEIEAIREHICVAPKNVREGGHADTLRLYGWLFNRPNEPQGRWNPLQIRNRSLPHVRPRERVCRPLFGGHWMLRNPTGGRDVHTVLRLSLNPMRFVRNQEAPRPIGLPATWGIARLNERDTAPNTRGEFALDGEDNWIPATGILQAFASAARWRQHLRRYVLGVAEAFTDELDRQLETHGGILTVRENFTLRKVEMAFDFAANEPTELVRSLIPLLSEYRADNCDVSAFPVPSESRAENSLCFRMGIRQGVLLRVYAKTNRRIRFEFIYEKINCRELLGEPPERGRNIGTPAPRAWDELFECLAALRARAADEMNALLQYLRQQSRVVESHYSPLSLMVRIGTILCDHELAHTVVSLLAKFGAISSRRASDELSHALHALSESGILAFDRTRRGYVPCAPYREAVAMLRGDESLYLLTTARQRRRINSP